MWIIIRRKLNGKENIVIEKKDYKEIEKAFAQYKAFAEAKGWFIYTQEYLTFEDGDYIENVENGLKYELQYIKQY